MVSLGTPPAKASVEIQPLKVYGVVDLVADVGIENTQNDTGRLRVGSFELGATTVVDSVWSANLNVGGHDEAGQIDFELHEAYVKSDQILPSTEIKAGRYYLGLGLLNRMHSYDWPFVSPPKMQAVFFAKEPVADTGVELTHRWTDPVAIELTVGVANGWSYTHRPLSGNRPLAATHYAHPTATMKLADNRTFSLGINYLGRTDVDSRQTRLAGLDFKIETRDENSGVDIFSLQGEIYHRIQSSSSLPLNEDIGGYISGETRLGDSRWLAGARVDGFTTLSLRDSSGGKRSNLDYGVTPNVSYRGSTASTFRISYSYLNETRAGDNSRAEQKVELQLTTIMGEVPKR